MAKLDPKARLEALEVVFAALAHAARRNILLALHFRGGSMTAGDIAARFEHTWPTTTRHLQALVNAGLLRSRKKGRTRIYEIIPERLDLIREWMAWFETKGDGK